MSNKYKRKKCKKCEYENFCVNSLQFHADEYCDISKKKKTKKK
jgi:hypothetical protein